MRIPRSNLTPASFNSESPNQGQTREIVVPHEGTAQERLRAIARQLRDKAEGTWESHFYLAPNVRFTRTPESVLYPPIQGEAANQSISTSADLQAQQAIEHETVTPLSLRGIEEISAPTPEERPAEYFHSGIMDSLMLLNGRMDSATVESALGHRFPDNFVEAAAPLIIEEIHTVPTRKTIPVLQALSDFAYFECMDIADEDLTLEEAIETATRTIPVHAAPFTPAIPAIKETRSDDRALSLYRSVEIPLHKPEAVRELTATIEVTPKQEEAVRPSALPWLVRGQKKMNQAEVTAPAATQKPALTIPASVPEELMEAPVLTARKTQVPLPEIIEPPATEPPVRDKSGVVISTPFAIENSAHPVRETEGYTFPARDLLQDPPQSSGFVMTQEQLERNAGLLESILEDFGVRGEIIHVRPGPVVTLYEFEPAPGVKSSRVIGLADDIARSMSALSARVAVVPGRNVIGIELPNATREKVYLRELIESDAFTKSDFKLPLALGKAIGGEPVIAELAKMPHLLVAGTTGSGKSVAINTMILSLLYTLSPEECRLIMVDPKMLELSVYDGIPHLLTPVVTDPKKAVLALKWAVREMEDRYRKMSRLGVRNIDGYNQRAAHAREKGETVMAVVQTGFEKGTGEPLFENQPLDLAPMPYIVVIVDEMADLMMVAGKEIEGAIQRLAQMARAAGIHLIMATQRPSVDVITGTIKANFPTRISFQVTSKIDSRTILGEQGAEQLLGQGDMLHMMGGGRICRVHGPFVSDEEVEHVVAHLKTQGRPEYLDTVTNDESEEDEEEAESAVFDKTEMGAEDGDDLYDKAVKVVLRDKKCSTSYIQRRLGIGYNRAASLVERMEKEGLVGAANHVGKREIISGSYGGGNDD